MRPSLVILRYSFLFCLLLLTCGDRGLIAQQLSTVRLSGSVEVATLSPDNSRIAAITLVSTEKESGVWEHAESMQVFDTSSSKVIASLRIPSASQISDNSLSSLDFLDYCDDARYIVAFDKVDALYIFDSSSYALRLRINIGDLRSRKGSDQILGGRIQCSAGSNLVAVNLYGGSAGWGSLKVFTLETGKEIAEAKGDPASGLEFGDIDLADDGSSVVVLLKCPQPPKGKDIRPNIQVRDAQTLRISSSFSIGGGARAVAFAGTSRLITVPQLPAGRSHDKGSLDVWSLTGAHHVERLSDSIAAVNAPISASANGDRVAGDISVLRECRLCNGLEGRVDVSEQRFGVWETNSGNEIMRSDPVGPMLQPIQPIYRLARNGRSVLVYWHGMNIMPKMFTVP